MPEVQIVKNHTDDTLTEDDKLNRIEELRQMIEGKYDFFTVFTYTINDSH